MTLQEFNDQLRRLNEVYNNYYTKDRKKTLWSLLSHLDSDFFERKVDKALWADHPPKIDWFQNIRRAFELRQEVTQQSSEVHPRDLSKFSIEEITNKLNELKSKL